MYQSSITHSNPRTIAIVQTVPMNQVRNELQSALTNQAHQHVLTDNSTAPTQVIFLLTSPLHTSTTVSAIPIAVTVQTNTMAKSVAQTPVKNSAKRRAKHQRKKPNSRSRDGEYGVRILKLRRRRKRNQRLRGRD